MALAWGGRAAQVAMISASASMRALGRRGDLQEDAAVYQVLRGLRRTSLDVHVAAATPEHDQDELRERLRRFLDEWQVEVSSNDLIAIGNAILRDDWKRRWPRHPRWLARRLRRTTAPSL